MIECIFNIICNVRLKFKFCDLFRTGKTSFFFTFKNTKTLGALTLTDSSTYFTYQGIAVNALFYNCAIKIY